MSIDEYVGKMKVYADELAAAGKALDDEELISYIITGLDLDYNPVISTALGRVDPISVTEFTSQLLAFEQRLNLYQGSSSSSSFSANVASRGRGGGRMFRGRGARGRGKWWAWTRELQQQLQLRQAEGPVSDLQEGGRPHSIRMLAPF